MKVEELNLIDLDFKNIDKTKVNLSNKIITNIIPVFNRIHLNKITTIKKLRSNLRDKKIYIKSEKEKLITQSKIYTKKKKVRKLLERISNLVQMGLIHDAGLRKEMIAVLKVMDKLSNKQLDMHLEETLKVLSKRF